jgi:hypothetical protein
MITCYLFGGIGNQIFQFLSGLNISKRENVPIVFDESLIFAFKNYHSTRLINVFDLNKSVTFKKFSIKYSSFFKLKFFFFNIAKNFNRFSVTISEKNYHNRLSLRRNYHQFGYFQDPIFIESNILNIRKILIFKKFFFKTKNFNQINSQKDSVCLHIRRGDYISKKGKKKYLTLDENYYRKAIYIMKQKLQNPFFFVFSDDHKYSSRFLTKIFKNEKYKLIFNSDDNHDFFLMSQCKNFIISNSTFSWWASNLSVSSTKVVICPKRWFVTNADNQNNNLILNEWLQL